MKLTHINIPIIEIPKWEHFQYYISSNIHRLNENGSKKKLSFYIVSLLHFHIFIRCEICKKGLCPLSLHPWIFVFMHRIFIGIENIFFITQLGQTEKAKQWSSKCVYIYTPTNQFELCIMILCI